MSRQSIFVFRIIIGAIFLLQYLVGIDGHGRGAGNLMILLFGLAFVGYGCFGIMQSGRT
jgi:hypothetical protein